MNLSATGETQTSRGHDASTVQPFLREPFKVSFGDLYGIDEVLEPVVSPELALFCQQWIVLKANRHARYPLQLGRDLPRGLQGVTGGATAFLRPSRDEDGRWIRRQAPEHLRDGPFWWRTSI